MRIRRTCGDRFTNYWVHLQHAAYVSCLEKLVPEISRPRDIPICIHRTRPAYAVSVIEPSGSMRELGQRQWSRAVKTWEQCLQTNRWPGYGGPGGRGGAVAVVDEVKR